MQAPAPSRPQIQEYVDMTIFAEKGIAFVIALSISTISFNTLIV